MFWKLGCNKSFHLFSWLKENPSKLSASYIPPCLKRATEHGQILKCTAHTKALQNMSKTLSTSWDKCRGFSAIALACWSLTNVSHQLFQMVSSHHQLRLDPLWRLSSLRCLGPCAVAFGARKTDAKELHFRGSMQLALVLCMQMTVLYCGTETTAHRRTQK